ncbi:MAG: TRAP transporter small permease [Desulfotalea sp.]
MFSRSKWLAEHFEEVLSVILLSLMATLAFAGVITRYVFQYPIAFTEELEVNALVWLTLFGTASAFRRKKHLQMLFFQDKMSPSVAKTVRFAINIVCIGLFASLGYLGYLQILDERFLEITSESLELPQWGYTICIPIGCSLIIFRILQSTIKDLRGTN